VGLGTGLGLAIVARIVRNMNGQLRAESEEGQGSKFTFVFNFPIPTTAQENAFIEAAATASPQVDHSQMTYATPCSPERRTQTRRHSTDSAKSCGSTNSGRSEIDQLVDMIGSQRLEDPPRSSGNINAMRRNSPISGRGEYNIQDSFVPVRPVKVDPDDVDVAATAQAKSNLSPARNTLKPALPFKPKQLRVLVAEDDPVNRAILKKRLEMDGHDVILTQNGSEVVEVFGKCWQGCDIILMDLQVKSLKKKLNI
jgi:hypothetical protein